MATKGLLAKKIGMTQVFTEKGELLPVTVLEAGPCTVVGLRAVQKDGYGAVQLGFGEVKEKKLTKAAAGHFKKAGVNAHRHLKEVRREAERQPKGKKDMAAPNPPSVAGYDREGKESGQVAWPEAVFNAPVNEAVLHQAVLRQQANDRQGTHSTKTRGEVSGGGKKPWKQKGTGRARQGSTRAPQWRDGGVVFGPHPRSYEQKMPRKQRRLALRAALSVKSQDGAVRVIEELALEEPKTRVLAELFAQMGVGARVLFVIPQHDVMLEKSTRNLAGIKTILGTNLNPSDVLTADTVVFTRSALTQVEEWLT